MMRNLLIDKKINLHANGSSSYKHQIFISHRGTQKKEVAFLIMVIFSYFCGPQSVAFDEVTLNLGDDNHTVLSNALSRSAHCLVLVSRDFFESPWTIAEVDAFLAAQKSAKETRKLIPLFIDISPSACSSIDMSNYLDKKGKKLSIKQIRHRQKLAKRISKISGRHRGQQESIKDFILKEIPDLMENKLREKGLVLLPEFENHVDRELLEYVYEGAVFYYENIGKGKINLKNLCELIRTLKIYALQKHNHLSSFDLWCSRYIQRLLIEQRKLISQTNTLISSEKDNVDTNTKMIATGNAKEALLFFDLKEVGIFLMLIVVADIANLFSDFTDNKNLPYRIGFNLAALGLFSIGIGKATIKKCSSLYKPESPRPV